MDRCEIPDSEIKEAAPEEVIEQYHDFVCRIASKYRRLTYETGRIDFDDLIQSGFIGLLQSQRTYDYSSNIPFMAYAFYRIKNEIRKCIFQYDNKLPEDWIIESLDREIAEDIMLADTVYAADPEPTVEERLAEESEREEIAAEVRAAVDRLKNENQKYIIKLLWFEGLSKLKAAEETGLSVENVKSLDFKARNNMKKDNKLRKFAAPLFHVGSNTYNTTWTSATEKAVLWLENQYNNLYGEGAFFSMNK